ncbi:unnamed protein product [Paramecium sonneborni]|uniref:Uncharacterized protein n=1 Tax=Paramecium sonneborni TaxID=65129 RepID=A0A8S1RVK1_9CILI|nr:unnamed protein product [Paramecium sonneborni]
MMYLENRKKYETKFEKSFKKTQNKSNKKEKVLNFFKKYQKTLCSFNSKLPNDQNKILTSSMFHKTILQGYLSNCSKDLLGQQSFQNFRKKFSWHFNQQNQKRKLHFQNINCFSLNLTQSKTLKQNSRNSQVPLVENRFLQLLKSYSPQQRNNIDFFLLHKENQFQNAGGSTSFLCFFQQNSFQFQLQQENLLSQQFLR